MVASGVLPWQLMSSISKASLHTVNLCEVDCVGCGHSAAWFLDVYTQEGQVEPEGVVIEWQSITHTCRAMNVCI